MTAAAAEWDLVATLEPGNHVMLYLSQHVIPVSTCLTCLPDNRVMSYLSRQVIPVSQVNRVMPYLSHHVIPVSQVIM